MADRAATALRRLVQLAAKAERSDTAIQLEDVFDDAGDRAAWIAAWATARRVVRELDEQEKGKPS